MSESPWRSYQETSASFFRELGMTAITDAQVEGVRSNHDVDVLVTFEHGGLDLTWLVECKHWKTRVSKVHVLAFRQILEDAGADRGLLLAEEGFQSGAFEAAQKSNVYLTSLADLRATAAEALNRRKLASFPERIAQAYKNYWSLSKTDRIELGIRSDYADGDRGYRGQLVLGACQAVLLSALADQYPPLGNYIHYEAAESIQNLEQAVGWLESHISELEARLETPAALGRMDIKRLGRWA